MSADVTQLAQDAATVAKVRLATIDECQKALRSGADGTLRAFPGSRVAARLAQGYRDAAALLEALKSR